MKINEKLLDKRKDILVIKTTSDYTISTSNTREQVTGFSIMSQIGNKLSLKNDKIVIGAGIKKVRVMYTAKCIASGSTTRIFTYLTMNNIELSQEGYFYGATNEQVSNTSLLQLRDVVEGDTFNISVYGTAGQKVAGHNTFATTALYVEVVEYE